MMNDVTKGECNNKEVNQEKSANSWNFKIDKEQKS